MKREPTRYRVANSLIVVRQLFTFRLLIRETRIGRNYVRKFLFGSFSNTRSIFFLKSLRVSCSGRQYVKDAEGRFEPTFDIPVRRGTDPFTGIKNT